MHPFRHKMVSYLSLISFLIFFMSGCSVLTQTQINAVNKFATATENYGITPSNAIEAWAELQITASAAEVASMKNEQTMWDHIESSFDTYGLILERSERALKSFQILTLYSNLLKQLSADSYTKALDSSSKEAGEALDSAVEFYNARFGASISTFGGAAAKVIRGAGGLYIRAKQGKALKKVVADAEQPISDLTKEIENIAMIVELGIDKELDTLKNEIKLALKYAPRIKDGATEYKIIPDLASYVSAFELLQRGRIAKAIVLKAKSAAIKYRKVHSRLVHDTRNKIENIEDLVQIIEALKAEIDAGIKLKG